jgi:hypothetical protein
MLLFELKAMVNSISEDYDDYKIFSGNPHLGANELDFQLVVGNYFGHEFLWLWEE